MNDRIFILISTLLLVAACDARSAPVDVRPSERSDTVTVMSYNIFHDAERASRGILPWTDRRHAIVDVIRDQAPDILGLQEAKVWQVAWLLEQMPEYAAVARGPFADPGIIEAETVAVLYLEARFDARESGHFWYSETPDTPGSHGSAAFGGMSAPRMATWVRLVDATGANPRGLYVFNTHFIADEHADDSGVARLRSAETLVNRIAEREHPGAHVLVAGDFNAAPDDWPLRYLLGSRCEEGDGCAEPAPGPELRLIDAWGSRNAGDSDTGTRCNAATGSDGMRVDYVLVLDPTPEEASCAPGSGLCASPEILRAEIVSGEGCPSDHRPVVATIELPGTG